jgi:drug/metabolite transporter (DMT)-like permease
LTDHTRGILAGLAAAVSVSTVPTALKVGLNDLVPPLQLLAPRMLLGAGLLWLWMLTTRRQKIRIDRPGMIACALAGLLNAFSLSLFYLCLTRLDASIANIVFSVYPALLLLMLLMRGESVTRLDWIRLVAALAGIWLIAGPGGDPDPLGITLAVTGAVGYALYVQVVHTRLSGYSTSTQALWIVTWMTLALQIPAALTVTSISPGRVGWLVILWSAVFGTVLARVLNLTAIRLVGGGQLALLAPFESALTVVWASLLLDERLSALQLLGGLLVVASVALAALRGRWRVWAGTPRLAVAAPVEADPDER